MEKEFVAIEPNVWKPEQDGDSVQGVLVKKEENVGVNNSRAYHLENEKGQFMVWGSTILDDRMSYVQIGQTVRITFKGKKENKKGQPVNIYKVEREVINEDIYT